MANHKSAEKRNRQRIARTERARAFRSRVRRALRTARTAVDAGREDADNLVREASRLLDRAASKNVLPSNKAARLKSRLARHAHKASG